jgi:hypothetical protein
MSITWYAIWIVKARPAPPAGISPWIYGPIFAIRPIGNGKLSAVAERPHRLDRALIKDEQGGPLQAVQAHARRAIFLVRLTKARVCVWHEVAI